MAVSGELRTKAAVLFKEQVNHPSRKTMHSFLPPAQLKSLKLHCFKRVKIFSTKGQVLNIDKRNSWRAMVVHKETKPLPLRKGIVSCETQYSKMTGSGFTTGQRIGKLTRHGSFMQTGLIHTTSNMLTASDEKEILKMGDNSYTQRKLSLK